MSAAAPPTESRRALDRSRARAWALQVHYAWETAGPDRHSLAEILGETLRTRRVSRTRHGYIERLVHALEEHLDEVDAALRRALDNWRIERLSSIDRGVLRIGAVELLFFPDIPAKVSIKEAIRLAEAYGGDRSPAFVNGVLDALFKAR